VICDTKGHDSRCRTDFVLGIIPDTLFSALTSQEVLQTLLVALLVGFAIQALGPKGEPAIRAIAVLQRVVSRSSR
jgi:aerobic C4-dicarboxylate transport protein